jgi:phosphoglycolate phosphatase-like HAD superfamily hydrolase
MKTILFDLDGTLVRLGKPHVCVADANLMARLSTEYQLVLVTGSPRAQALDALNVCGYAKVFSDRIIAAEDTSRGKRSGEPFLKALQQFAVRAHDAVVVGDSESDQIGTAIAGIPFVQVAYTHELNSQKALFASAIEKARSIFEKSNL